MDFSVVILDELFDESSVLVQDLVPHVRYVMKHRFILHHEVLLKRGPAVHRGNGVHGVYDLGEGEKNTYEMR